MMCVENKALLYPLSGYFATPLHSFFAARCGRTGYAPSLPTADPALHGPAKEMPIARFGGRRSIEHLGNLELARLHVIDEQLRERLRAGGDRVRHIL